MMIRMGIIGENFQNDACALKSFIAPQYKDTIEFVPILKGLNGGTPPIKKVKNLLPIDMSKHKLNALLCVLDLDTPTKWADRKAWFQSIKKSTTLKSIFYVAVMELEALILADIDTFNKIYKIKGQYTKNPMVNTDPKSELKNRTYDNARKYDVTDAEEIFKQLNFEIVYRKHIGEHSFHSFIDDFEEMYKVKRIKKK
jgi:hypothetical protein